MAIKPFNSVGGYSVGPNLTLFVDENNNANVADLTVNGSIGGNINELTLSGDLTVFGNANLVTANISTDLAVGGNISAPDVIVGNSAVFGSMAITEGQLTVTGQSFEIVGTDQSVQLHHIDSSTPGKFALVFADNTGAGLVTDAGEIVVGADGNVTVSDSMSIVADLTVDGNVTFTGPSVDIGTAANLKIHGAATGQYLRSLDGGTGTVEWATIDTDTLANGTSNVSIDNVDGPVTVGVAGNANVAVFSGTGLTVQSNIAAGNIALTGNVTTANLTANGLVTLGSNANVKITGGTANLVLTTDGTGNLSWTNQSLKYTREIHVDPTVGNDTTGDGSYNRPYATIMKAHSIVTSGFTVFLHVGSYSENVTWTKTNCDIIGLSEGGMVNCTGIWIVGTTTPSSVRIKDIAFNGTFTQNSTGRLIMRSSYLRSTFTKSSGEYTQFDDVDASGTGISIASAGTVVFNGGTQNMITVSNAGAVVSINNTIGTASITVTAGTVVASDSYIYALTNTGNAVTTSAGTAVYLYNSHCIAPNQSIARISMAGFWTANDTQYDKANSTLTGTNLGTISHFDALNTQGAANVGTLTVRGTSSLGPVGNVTITGGTSGQYLQTNGSGALSFSTVSLSNINNGTSNVSVAASGDITIASNGQGNIVTIASNGTFATTTINDDVIVTGNLTVQGNTISVNVTELNVEDPIITEGRGPNNAPLTTNDGKDRGLFSYYYDGSEKGAFIGIMTTGAHAGEYVVSTDAVDTDNVITVNSYGNIVVGNVIGNLANGTTSVGIAGADGNVTLSVAGTANVVVADATGIDVAGSVRVRTVTAIDASTATTTSVTPTVIAEVDYANGLAVEFLVRGRDTVAAVSEVNTVMVVCEGGAADHSIYGTVNSGSSVGGFTVAVNSGKLQLIATAASANSTAWVVQFRTI